MGQSTWQKEQISARKKRVRQEVAALMAKGSTKTDAVMSIARDMGLSTVTVFSDLKDEGNDDND